MNREILKIAATRFFILGMMISCLYLPLFASLLENELLGSDNVYEAFDAIGLAEPLGNLYDPLLNAIGFLFDL